MTCTRESVGISWNLRRQTCSPHAVHILAVSKSSAGVLRLPLLLIETARIEVYNGLCVFSQCFRFLCVHRVLRDSVASVEGDYWR